MEALFVPLAFVAGAPFWPCRSAPTPNSARERAAHLRRPRCSSGWVRLRSRGVPADFDRDGRPEPPALGKDPGLPTSPSRVSHYWYPKKKTNPRKKG